MVVAPATAQDVAFGEAPILAEQVEAGELPPVAERLPSNPLVVDPVEEIGQYGGTLRKGLSGGGDSFYLLKTMGYEPLLRWTSDWDGWYPNVAESLEINEDSTEFTFTLREGMRWSDGAPFTTADVEFWWNHVINNEEINPSISRTWQAGGEVAEVEIIDEQTFVFRFAAPYGFFPLRMATNSGIVPVGYPRHYLEQFHPDFNENAVALAQEAGYTTWVDYFVFLSERQGFGIGQNPDLPTLDPWIMRDNYPGGQNVVIAERNPYYFKVDPEGNQLPYIDRIQWFVAEDTETLVLQGLNGDIDMQARHIGALSNLPIFFDAQEAGDFRLFDHVSTLSNAMCLYPNLSTQDPVLSELFLNKDFRIAMSHAINRQEIIDLIYLGQATPSQAAPEVDGVFGNEQMSFQYTEYDPGLANELLDAMIPDRGGDGFRLGPDGEALIITADVNISDQEHVDAMELVANYFADVGLNLNVNVVDRSIMDERQNANESEIYVWPAGGGAGFDVTLNPQAFFPDRAGAFHAAAWGDWFATGGETGIEPPAEIQEMQNLYTQLQSIGDADRQVELMRQILQLSADYFPQPCIATEPDSFGIVQNNLRNVPESMFLSSNWPDPGATNPEQYFFVQE